MSINDTIEQKFSKVNQATTIKLTEKLGANVMRRFIPFIQMYEFEGLLFSDPKKMALGMDKQNLMDHFQKISDGFTTPEHINNSQQTAPSKRILSVITEYEKPLMGALAALEVGLDSMRNNCHLFDQWLSDIEAIAVKGN